MTLTSEQFNILATKDDVKKEIFESEERIRKDINKVLTAVDGLAKKTENVEVEQTSNIVAHDRYEKRITKNEENIIDIQRHLNLKPAV